jgi:CheY-like chemotaxis protein
MAMTQPLVIVFYERLMPGSQLVNRLQDLNYRVLAVNNPAQLAPIARRESPLLVVVDLDARGDVCDAIARVKADAATGHLPVIAFAPDNRPELFESAQKAGASLAVGESALTSHLQAILQQALQFD